MKNYFLLFFALIISRTAFLQQSEDIVTLTTTGNGNTIEEAKNNALRSAIEMAFGAFISSNSEILNDNLVKDEIVLISSGNIVSFDIISELKLPNGMMSLTVSSEISKTKLITFCENKGILIEFKGALFSTNINIQKLNEEAEYKTILNLCEVSIELLKKALDFNVKTSDPIQDKDYPDFFHLQYIVESHTNKNYLSFVDFFQKSIAAISMDKNEILEYQKLNKPVYSFDMDIVTLHVDKKGRKVESHDSGHLITLRNKKSANSLINLFIRTNVCISAFKILNDIEEITVKDVRSLNIGDGSPVGLINFNFNPFSFSSWGWFFGYAEEHQYEVLSFNNNLKLPGSIENSFLDNLEVPFRGKYNIDDFPHFGKLILGGNEIFVNVIDKEYPLYQLNKISFVKVNPLY